MRILLRTWPWLKPMVIGTWRERALPVSTKRQPGHGVGFRLRTGSRHRVRRARSQLLGRGASTCKYDLLLVAVLVMAESSWVATVAWFRTGTSRWKHVAFGTPTTGAPTPGSCRDQERRPDAAASPLDVHTHTNFRETVRLVLCAIPYIPYLWGRFAAKFLLMWLSLLSA